MDSRNFVSHQGSLIEYEFGLGEPPSLIDDLIKDMNLLKEKGCTHVSFSGERDMFGDGIVSFEGGTIQKNEVNG